jgi:O-antigen/teichoic acid export membrane protein
MVEPTAYGLIGMLAIFMALGAAFTDLAFSAALVQNKTITADDETSVFYLNIVAGIVLTLLLCAVSPLVAHFYRGAVLIPLLCAQALTIFISSFGIVQSALISRTMAFKSNALIEVVSSMCSGVVGVVMAWMGKGVWSLVGLNLAKAACSVVLLWLVRDWRPRGTFRMANVRAMWSYSSKLLYASLIHRVVTNLYTVLIGRAYPAADLGIYTRANSFQALPVGILTGIVQRIAFPLYSRYQTQPAVLLSLIRRQVRFLVLGSTVILAILTVVSDDLIPLLLGPKWNEVIPLLKILCLGGVFACLFPLHTTVIQSLGHSSLFFRIDLLKKVTIVTVVLSLYRFGITALAWGTVLISLTDYVISAFPNVRLIGYRWRMQLADILPTLLLCGAAAGCVSLIRWGYWASPLLVMVLKIVLLGIFIGGGIVGLRKLFFADIWVLGAAGLERFRVGRPPVLKPSPTLHPK